MSVSDYELMPGIRRSDLWYIRQTPLHFKYHMEHPEEPTPALIFGQAAHKYVLEPESFFDEFTVMPKYDRRTKAGKDAYNAFMDANFGKTPITDEDLQTMMTMRQALMADGMIREIMLNVSEVEAPYRWTDPETGELCKCKVDMISTINDIPYIVDFKTTTSCEDGAFERSCRKYGYDFQAGFYTEGVESCTLEEHGFIFIAQEKTEPYAPRLYWCDPGFVSAGKRKFHELLRLYHNCKETGDWYGYQETDLYEEEYD